MKRIRGPMTGISAAIATTLSSQFGASALGQVYRYAVFELTPINGAGSYPRAINERGDVVGDSLLVTNRLRATMWTAEGDVVDLGTLGGNESLARDINDSRAVIGYSYRPGGGAFRYNAFLWRDGQMTDLGTLSGDTAEAYGINNSEQVVGFATIIPGQGTPYSAFIWDAGMMTELAPIEGAEFSRASAIGEQGQAVGWSLVPNYPSLQHAVQWANGEILDLGTLGPPLQSDSLAYNINSLGHIVGYSTSSSGKEHAFIWVSGRMYDLGTFNGVNQTYAYAINSQTDVVGFGARDADPETFRGFIWQLGKGMQPLSDLLPPDRPAWRITTGWDINDAGQIACKGYRQNDGSTARGLLLSPVHPTMDMSPLLPGNAGTSNTITVAGVTPGARVTFLYSRHGGGTRIPGCDLQQNALQLDNPTVIGTAIANQNGVATITRPVPLIARGQTIFFQAVVQNECAVSQLVVHRFE